LRHNTAIIVFLWEGKEGSDSNAMERTKSKLEKTFSGWDITFEDDSSFSREKQKEICREHYVGTDLTDFVRIGFVSGADQKSALELLGLGVFEGRRPLMAVVKYKPLLDERLEEFGREVRRCPF